MRRYLFLSLIECIKMIELLIFFLKAVSMFQICSLPATHTLPATKTVCDTVWHILIAAANECA